MKNQPDIIVIMSDQHHAGFMGHAGHPYAQTPNLDRLARQGVCFTKAYTSCPVCTPARMGFMTGQSPSAISNWLLADALSSDTPTFAHGLGAAGYETVLCGKMHFAGSDQFHGFEKRLMSDPAGKELYPPEQYRSGKGIWSGTGVYPVEASGHGYLGFQHYDREVTRNACRFLTERKEDRPFMLTLGYVAPHNPYVCEKRWFDYYDAIVPELPAFTEEDHQKLPKMIQRQREASGLDQLTPQQHRRALVAYLGLVSELDEQVGAVLDLLENTGRAENTVVIYCTDHGDMATEHGLWYKRTFYEASVRIPLLISWPGKALAGQTVSNVVSLLDLAPTLLQIGNAPSLPRSDGRTLVPLLTGQKADWDDTAWAEEAGQREAGVPPTVMLRQGDWKFIHYHRCDEADELYNLQDDPDEMSNRIHDAACGEVRERLRRQIAENWDGERAARKIAASLVARKYNSASGHAPIPHPLPASLTCEGLEPFDLRQLPHIPAYINQIRSDELNTTEPRRQVEL
jgi:choline-sulfatase